MSLSALFDGRIGTFLMALVAIAALGILVMLVMRLFGRGLKPSGRNGRPSRLAIVDAFDLDRHRQLVIVRRDNVEHLIMIGGPNDLVIESAIERAQPAVAERREPLVGAPASAPQARQAPPPPPPPPAAPPVDLRPTLDVPPVPEPAPAPPSRPAPVMPRATTPPTLRGPIVPPPPAPPVEAPKAAEKANDPPRLAVNIDSLEEEMSRLLGRPPEQK